MRLTRRSVLAAASLAAVSSPAHAASMIYVAPNGRGSGAHWGDAAGLQGLTHLIARAGPGGQVLLAADAGPYDLNSEVQIVAGGAAGAFVHVRGVNRTTGSPQPALLRGNAQNRNEGFRLLRGARFLRFSHFRFEDFGNGCFRVGAPVNDLAIEDCSYEGVYRFLENTVSGSETSASLTNFAVRRVRGQRTERGFLRLRYASRTGVVEDCMAQGQATQSRDYPAGCALEDTAGDITYRRCIMSGFQQWRAGTYWNGDGFSDEAGNYGIRYEQCEARASTDGGFDCKSRNVVLDRCVAVDNKRNFRLWSARATLTGCTSRAPNFRGAGEESASSCHVWIGGEGGHVVDMQNFTVEDRDATAIFAFENDSVRVDIERFNLRSPRQNWGDGRSRLQLGNVLTVTPGP